MIVKNVTSEEKFHVLFQAVRENGYVFENTFNTPFPYVFSVGSDKFAEWFTDFIVKYVYRIGLVVY